MNLKRKSKGFSLTELMVTVSVVAILASIAYPSYTNQMKKTRRVDAQGALMGLASAMERFYTVNNTYIGTTDNGAPRPPLPTIYPSEAPLSSSPKYYDLVIQDITASSYILRAVPKDAQAGDGYLELDSTGAKMWDKNDDGIEGIGENTW
jgi:type IV pilus assembly protein PilE